MSTDAFIDLNYYVKTQKYGRLRENARMIKSDSKSLYTNIDIDHALHLLWLFLEELKDDGRLPEDFDIDMCIEAAALIMTLDLFEYRDTLFKQVR